MIKNIKISYFKAIQGEPLELKSLTKVNYLVAPNGSGKSSVIEAINGIYFFGKVDWDNNLNELKEWANSSLEEDFKIELKTQLSLIQADTTGRSINATIQIDDQEYTVNNLEVKPNPIIQNDGFIIYSDHHSNITNFIRDEKLLGITNVEGDNYKFKSFYRDYILSSGLINTSDVFFLTFNEDGSHYYFVNYKEDEVTSFLQKVKDDINETKIDAHLVSTGNNHFKEIFLILIMLKSKYNVKILFLEEPEKSLHPSLQKLLAKYLIEFSYLFDIQLIITTHSPFLISAATQLNYEQKEVYDRDNNGGINGFVPSQKVYTIDEGRCTNPKGYTDYRAASIASSMMGAGLTDLGRTQIEDERIDNSNQYIVFCEGIGNDAKLYNSVSKGWNQNVIFISSNGSNEAIQQCEVNRELLKLQKGKPTYLALLDGDKKDRENEYIKCIPRLKIENYIYDLEFLFKIFEFRDDEYQALREFINNISNDHSNIEWKNGNEDNLKKFLLSMNKPDSLDSNSLKKFKNFLFDQISKPENASLFEGEIYKPQLRNSFIFIP